MEEIKLHMYKNVKLGEIKGLNQGYIKKAETHIKHKNSDTPIKFPPNIRLQAMCGLFIYLITAPLFIPFLIPYIFKYFYKYIDTSFFNPHTYQINTGSFLLRRFLFSIIGIVVWLLTPYFILSAFLELFQDYDGDEEWGPIYESLIKHGYEPHNYESGYIRVTEDNGEFTLIDGNHRVALLLNLFGSDYVVNVKIDTEWGYDGTFKRRITSK